MASMLQVVHRCESYCRPSTSGRVCAPLNLPGPSGRHHVASAGKPRQRAVAAAAFPLDAPSPLYTPLDQQMASMERDMLQQFDRAFTSPFADIQRMEQQMDAQLRALDRQMEQFDQDMHRFNRDMDAAMSQSLKDLQQQQPEVRIERQEQRSPGMYRYYESIHIQTGPRMAAIVPLQAVAPAPLFSPILFAAVLLAGAYAALSAAFARNYDLTTYQQQKKWQLLLLWPVLALVSKSFRQQWWCALRGEKVAVTKPEQDGAQQ